MNIDIYIDHITPGNPCKRISTVTRQSCSLEVQVLLNTVKYKHQISHLINRINKRQKVYT